MREIVPTVRKLTQPNGDLRALLGEMERHMCAKSVIKGQPADWLGADVVHWRRFGDDQLAERTPNRMSIGCGRAPLGSLGMRPVWTESFKLGSPMGSIPWFGKFDNCRAISIT
jgi:hypothetical protein